MRRRLWVLWTYHRGLLFIAAAAGLASFATWLAWAADDVTSRSVNAVAAAWFIGIVALICRDLRRLRRSTAR
jgi:hypothetical protein